MQSVSTQVASKSQNLTVALAVMKPSKLLLGALVSCAFVSNFPR